MDIFDCGRFRVFSVSSYGWATWFSETQKEEAPARLGTGAEAGKI
jgi:hypothetical protein